MESSKFFPLAPSSEIFLHILLHWLFSHTQGFLVLVLSSIPLSQYSASDKVLLLYILYKDQIITFT